MHTDSHRKQHQSTPSLHLDIAEQLVVVGGDDHVHRLDGASERLVHLLRGKVELQQSAVNLGRTQK